MTFPGLLWRPARLLPGLWLEPRPFREPGRNLGGVGARAPGDRGCLDSRGSRGFLEGPRVRKGAYSDLGRKGNHRSQGVRENMPRTAGTHQEGPKKSAYGLGLIGKGVMADSRQKKRPLAWMVSEAALPPGSTEPSSTLPLGGLTSAARTQLLSSSRKPGFSPSRPSPPPAFHPHQGRWCGRGGE